MSATPTFLADSTTGYPLLDIFWTMLWFFLWIMWFFLLIRIIGDVFRSQDLSGGAKAGWTIFIIILPYLGALVYIIVRGGSMHTRDQRSAEAADKAMRDYVRSTVGPTAGAGAGGTADELTKLADLRDKGVITDQEFTAQKAKILA